MPERNLSNLELTVLGLAWLRGPCTTYAIMKELSMSASSYHKGRAGTTYSVTKRLLEFGLLDQGGDQVQITETGIEALQKWLRPPLEMQEVSHSADLIRLRFFFLGVVDQPERLAFIENALEGLRVFLKRCKELVRENEAIGDYFGALATLSSVMETRARIEWLETVRTMVEDPIGDRSQWAKSILESVKKEPRS